MTNQPDEPKSIGSPTNIPGIDMHASSQENEFGADDLVDETKLAIFLTKMGRDVTDSDLSTPRDSQPQQAGLTRILETEVGSEEEDSKDEKGSELSIIEKVIEN